jgi:hypothetical protein
LTEGVLEEYSFNRLPEQITAVVEEHLLVCPDCQEALQSLEDFIRLVSIAIADEDWTLALPHHWPANSEFDPQPV